MGRFFLLAIVAAAIWGGWSLYSGISKLTNPPPKVAQPVVQVPSVEPEGQDSSKAIKTPPVASSSEKKEPLRVVSSNHEWIQIESWAIVRVGDPLPDGSRLESWDRWEVVTLTQDGVRERQRIRTVGEALAELVPAVAAVAGQGGFEASQPAR